MNNNYPRGSLESHLKHQLEVERLIAMERRDERDKLQSPAELVVGVGVFSVDTVRLELCPGRVRRPTHLSLSRKCLIVDLVADAP